MKDNDTLSLGNKTLVFRGIPFTHWPDNTTVYIPEDKIIFTSDLFGAHLASGSIFNDDIDLHIGMARAYYAEIMMPFAAQCIKYTNWISELDLDIIAPSHGPLWLEPERIFAKYRYWSGEEKERKVVIAYVSMHSSTLELVQRLVLRLKEKQVPYSLHNIAAHKDSLSVEIGEVASELVEAGALILAAPTVLTNPHPACIYAAAVVNTLKPKTKVIGFMGSFAWASKAAQVIPGALSAVKAEFLEGLMVKGAPTAEDFAKVDAYAEELISKLDASLA